MYRWIALLVLFALIYWAVKRALLPPREKSVRSGEENLVRDPVCGCYVPETQAISLSYNGKKLFFCGADCLQKYQSTHSLPKS